MQKEEEDSTKLQNSLIAYEQPAGIDGYHGLQMPFLLVRGTRWNGIVMRDEDGALGQNTIAETAMNMNSPCMARSDLFSHQ